MTEATIYTRKAMKRMEHNYEHPIFHYRKPGNVTCIRCGAVRKYWKMKEIGLDVYVCRDCKEATA